MTNQVEPLIFLCHAKEDKLRVRELYHKLKAASYRPWLDDEDLLGGQDWWTEIENIISDPYNLVVVCLSRKSVTKRGVVQQEIARALDVLDQMPEDTIYLIPARLEPCDVPRRLTHLHWINLFEPDGFEKLGRALDFELGKRQSPTQLELAKDAAAAEPASAPHQAQPAAEPRGAQPATRELSEPFEPELIPIPAGEFLMGSDPKKDQDAYDDEQPQHHLQLPTYYMAKTPVTNVQYLAFVEATGHRQPRHWESGKPPANKGSHPVVEVTWDDAMAYCRWLAEVTRNAYRLPSEAEWEKAARGADGRIYPWGDEWDAKRCNTGEGGPDGTTSVGQYSPLGDSPYGCVDMAGNVWEWTLSIWGKDMEKPDFRYPYRRKDGRESLESVRDIRRVLRGGAFGGDETTARCAVRLGNFPHLHGWSYGFRVVVAPL